MGSLDPSGLQVLLLSASASIQGDGTKGAKMRDSQLRATLCSFMTPKKVRPEANIKGHKGLRI